ncbi:ANTAR domain-containing response regulator [Rhodococcus sp. NPDC056743]|uniref:ANTAR domain-containing response regulator n=1 Tax=Rhodococcus sp. NPDC056743 TaxID=3345934 RepID=UPI00367022BA
MTTKGGITMHDDALYLCALTHFASPPLECKSATHTLHDLACYIADIFGTAAASVTVTLPDQPDITSISDAEFDRCEQEFRTGPGGLPRLHSLQITDVPGAAHAWPAFAAQASHLGVKAVATLPLYRETRNVGGSASPTHIGIGTLTVFSHEMIAWDDDDVTAARALTAVAMGFILMSLELQEHERVSLQLQHALETRIVVEQAKGIISKDHNTTIDSAYQLIRRRARSHNATVLSVARAIVELGLKV